MKLLLMNVGPISFWVGAAMLAYLFFGLVGLAVTLVACGVIHAL
jgi:hypothetical protein